MQFPPTLRYKDNRAVRQYDTTSIGKYDNLQNSMTRNAEDSSTRLDGANSSHLMSRGVQIARQQRGNCIIATTSTVAQPALPLHRLIISDPPTQHTLGLQEPPDASPHPPAPRPIPPLLPRDGDAAASRRCRPCRRRLRLHVAWRAGNWRAGIPRRSLPRRLLRRLAVRPARRHLGHLLRRRRLLPPGHARHRGSRLPRGRVPPVLRRRCAGHARRRLGPVLSWRQRPHACAGARSGPRTRARPLSGGLLPARRAQSRRRRLPGGAVRAML